MLLAKTVVVTAPLVCVPVWVRLGAVVLSLQSAPINISWSHTAQTRSRAKPCPRHRNRRVPRVGGPRTLSFRRLRPRRVIWASSGAHGRRSDPAPAAARDRTARTCWTHRLSFHLRVQTLYNAGRRCRRQTADYPVALYATGRYFNIVILLYNTSTIVHYIY